eukprot:Plantae.Rhodophyta-Purpureofilum_apyrenoidigerum.ctg27053.p1 GENE.Plantae.Rhodophyta-Purpureofilum_apyrenoidigerum.ctg27053~~Plantae.Rhodophyta-Purpureofilum_apyrenoidigerum.ctg27053.p1  ORF type:complete len:387 (+),score=35.00 Plantae.Rhodophyta-Purpureofilum_apyrenoidigerum.ctg27053:176-1162(+)
MEVRSAGSGPETVIFVHGSFHSAWCWDNFVKYFSTQGFSAHAISLRGTSESSIPSCWGVDLTKHAEDIEAAVGMLSKSRPPSIVAHSFGGLAALRYIELGKAARSVAFMCSVLPSSFVSMILRLVRERGVRAIWHIFYGLVLRAATRSIPMARTLFFTPNDDDVSVGQAMAHFKNNARPPIDFRKFLDVMSAPTGFSGEKLPRGWVTRAPPVSVLGAGNDYIIDRRGINELAEYFDTEAVILEDMPHDVMLTADWEKAAYALLRSIQQVTSSETKIHRPSDLIRTRSTESWSWPKQPVLERAGWSDAPAFSAAAFAVSLQKSLPDEAL